MMMEALALPLFHRALLAGLLASIACGIVGTYVVTKRIASISGGLSHAAFGGVGLAYFLGFSPMLGALGFCVACGIILAQVYRKRKTSLDTLIAMLWSLGMALGMVFVALTPGSAPDLSSYLFGSIIFVPSDYLLFTAALDIVLIGVTYVLFHQLQAVAFDEEFSEAAGLPVDRLFLALIILTALTVVTLIRVAGVILTIALLTSPAVIARQWSHSLRRMMLLSVAITGTSIVSGLFLTYYLSSNYGAEVPTGPVIILLLSCVYILSSVTVWWKARGTLS